MRGFISPAVAALIAAVVPITSCADLTTGAAVAAIAAPVNPYSASVLPEVYVSELHYDNEGTDTDERIEITGPAGMDLGGWSVVLYNGSGGASYHTDNLSGVLPATCEDRGVVVLEYPSNGIQNGSPDGIALVSPTGVVEFLSYEGTFAATDGPAAGMTSVDIGVAQGGSTPLGSSLQRNENGWIVSDGSNSFGACNDAGSPPPPPPPPPPPGGGDDSQVQFTELHYDNDGTDEGERIEITGPAGKDLSGWSVVLYNGNGGTPYDTRALSGALPATCTDLGVLVLEYPANGIQNGAPDGMALVSPSGVVEFLSYEGTFTAASGPAAGMTSTDVGVQESTSMAVGSSLQRVGSGWVLSVGSNSFGACNSDAPPPPPVNHISISGRRASDAPLPVGFEDQLFATLLAADNTTIPSTFTWTSLTPDVAAIDERGVMHALSAGSATFQATAAEGTVGTITLPTIVATASTTAAYANHTEFGEPADADPTDDIILRRTEYTASFNPVRNIPNWVSYNLEATHIQPGQDRCDCFTYDPMLPANLLRYTTADYTGAGAAAGFGIDRGHLARSFDRTAGTLDNAHTFYFSNIVPQAADNNQGPWAALENYLGDLAQSGTRELFIVAGASGSKGTVKDEGLITIPEYVWKVAVILPRDQGLANVDSEDDVEIVAVVLPNVPGIRNVDWNTYRVTVDSVESLSGYDVLSLLPDDVEIQVESGLPAAIRAVTDALPAGNANSLQSKLRAALASIQRGNTAAARGQLAALSNEVDALVRAGRVSAENAAAVRAALASALRSLGG